ncbi:MULTISPECIES: ATP-binding protein [Ramlibacter]|uniref:ATP-binding protein n=1 Tax=Ramlibacter aquaticus TaxID=2780094 RepID=A0ABR9SCL9_9BURK|nr:MULTISPECIES: ATP-binding protein [Ramlibacter]MBE7940095.1 ATP-binding protein [Ramlibacter aquaticus]
MNQHPLTYDNGARLQTPPLQDLNEALTKFAFQGCVCLMVYGMPRAGKSTGCMIVAERVEAKKAAVVYRTVIKSLTGTFSTLLQALQISRGGQVRFPSLKVENAFVRQVKVDCDEMGTERVWILIDEAQYLSYEQLIGLKGMLTEMAANGLVGWNPRWFQPGESLWSVANKVAFTASASVSDVLRLLAGVLDRCREGWLFPTTDQAVDVCELIGLPMTAAKGQLFAEPWPSWWFWRRAGP